jgi:polysaccharide pyruvyl transferase WcaK-like protein
MPVAVRTKILFLPASQIDNAGDQLINLAAIAALRPHGDIVVDDRLTPEWFLQGIGARPDERFTSISSGRFYVGAVKMLLRRKLSGEAVRYCFVMPPGHLFRRGVAAARTATVWHLKLLLLRALGCRVCRAGFSIGPFDRINLWAERFGAVCHSYYGLRDTTSLALARRHGFTHVHQVPDLAWTYRPTVELDPSSPQGHVVLSFRANATGESHQPDYLEPLLDRLKALLRASGLRQRRLVVAHQVRSDRAAAEQTYHALKDEFDVEWRADKLSIDEASTLYAGAHCVISNRLHVLLLAARNGTLPLALARGSDNVKITSILVDNALDDVVVDVGLPEADNRERLVRALSSREAVIGRFAEAARENTAKVRRAFATMLGA